MFRVVLVCVLAVCLVPQIRVGASLEPSTGDLCQLPPYNTKNLTREKYWFANNVSSSTGSRGSLCIDPNATSCTFYFSFCHPLNITDCRGAAVCQTSKNSNGTLTGYSLGQFSNMTQFYETNGTVAGSFYMDVINGTTNTWDTECAENTTGASTRIVLKCNPTVQWNSQDLTDIVSGEYSEPCSYTITIPYAGACRPTNPTTTSPIPVPTTSSSSTTSSHSVKSTSPAPGPSNTTVVPSASTATASPSISTTSRPAGSSSTVGPNPTVTPGPNPPTTTNPEHPNTTTHEGPTDHHTTPEKPTKHHTTPEKPTEHHTTRKPQPKNDDSHVIHGLIAGVVIFALISVVLLVMLIFAGRVIYTKGGAYRRVSNNDDM